MHAIIAIINNGLPRKKSKLNRKLNKKLTKNLFLVIMNVLIKLTQTTQVLKEIKLNYNFSRIGRHRQVWTLGDRAYGAKASGVLTDAGVINSNHTDLVIDKNEARRSRLAAKENLKSIISFLMALLYLGCFFYLIVL